MLSFRVRGSTFGENPAGRRLLGETFDLSGLLDEYRDEARGQLDTLESALLELEREAELGDEKRSALLRALHTLKGNSGMLGFAPVSDYVHHLESLFRAPPAEWPSGMVDGLFRGLAELRRALDRLGTDEEEAALARVAALPSPTLLAAGEAPPPTAAPVRSGPDGAAPAEVEAEPPTEDDTAPVVAGTEMLRVSFSKLDTLANLVAELLGVEASLEDLLRSKRADLERVGLRRALQRRAEQLERISSALRSTAMDLRLIPVRRVFQRFPRLVRDLAREQGKQIRVIIEGEDTELDKSTVDILAEPLLHLVRNAVDHGIGTPAERQAMGKSPEGTIILRAMQSGDRVRIEVEDDGRGLDRANILERARAAGLLEPDEQLTSDEVAALILRPGFSTRREADAISGRGIGLDVVASSVIRLRGSLDVEDRPGRGTRFVLHLPLTVAILPALLFEAAGETLALPALEIEDTIRVAQVSWVAGAEVVAHGEEMIPLARAERFFGWEAMEWSADGVASAGPPNFAIVVRRGTRAAAVAADRLLEQRDVVVKALPEVLGQPRGVSGATIAPDNRVILVLDAAGVIDLNLQSHRRAARVAQPR
jgi:two-component system, chemotaxis family, sensor kinase CheA